MTPEDILEKHGLINGFAVEAFTERVVAAMEEYAKQFKSPESFTRKGKTSEIVYTSDKNFNVKLRAMIDRKLTEHGYKINVEFFGSLNDAEEELFEGKLKKEEVFTQRDMIGIAEQAFDKAMRNRFSKHPEKVFHEFLTKYLTNKS